MADLVSKLRTWAFSSIENNESNDKLLAVPSSPSSSVSSSDEEQCSPRPRPQTKPHAYDRIQVCAKISFGLVFLTIILTAAFIFNILSEDSSSGIVANAPLPPSQGGSKVIEHCGLSAQEAMDRGCLWDIMSFGWIHPACYDREESDRWAEKYGPFEWYIDDGQPVDEKEEPLNGTLTQPLSLDEIPFTQSVWTSQGYHVMHCLYLLKMVHVAALHDAPVSNEAVNLGHTDHCVGLIGNTDLIEYDVITTPVRLLFVQCVTLT
ncbi:hypothetical protein LSUB1_G001941 [Lachnellula subtilissima]|uniref:Uncharacterized protein n=1 Tax=Lachnellula subtilissima TaxID=602034 RepID=A0A8H8UCB6_9HELO|nr:hypothetical protein LSUB1_G001941 [Lachnellula subtilissima]